MVHIRDTAKRFVELADRIGFNGVPVNATLDDSVTREEVVPSEMTDAGYDEWRRDYASFTFEPDFFALRPSGRSAESRYVSVEIDEAKFWRDVNDVLREKFGPGVTITFREGCHEFEVIRVKADAVAQ